MLFLERRARVGYLLDILQGHTLRVALGAGGLDYALKATVGLGRNRDRGSLERESDQSSEYAVAAHDATDRLHEKSRRTVRPEICCRIRAWGLASEGRAPLMRGGKAPAGCWLPLGRRALAGPGEKLGDGREPQAGGRLFIEGSDAVRIGYNAAREGDGCGSGSGNGEKGDRPGSGIGALPGRL